MLPFLAVGILFWIFTPNKTVIRTLKSIAIMIGGFGLYILINLGFVLPVLMGLLHSGVANYAASAKFVVPTDNFLGYLKPFYFDSFFPNAISPFLTLNSSSETAFDIVIGLLILFATVLPLIFARKRNRALSVSLWVTFLLTMTMVLLIRVRSPLVQIIYGSFSLIWPINSVDIYLLIFAGLLSLMFALGLDTLLNLWERICLGRSKTGYFKIMALIACLVFIIAPVGAMMLNHNEELLNPQSFSTGAVGTPFPSYINELGNFFNIERANVGPFRVLWVPQSNRVNMVTQSNDVYSDFSLSGVTPGVHSKFELLVNTINSGNSNDVGFQLALLGYRYIVVLNDFQGDGSVLISSGSIDTYLTGAPASFEHYFDSAGPDIKLIQRTESYSLYLNDFPTEFWHGMLWATNSSDVLSYYSSPVYSTWAVLGNDSQWSSWNFFDNATVSPVSTISSDFDKTNAIKGSSSLKLNLIANEYGLVDSGIWRWFNSSLNLNSKYLSFGVYGTGKLGQIQIILSSNATSNFYNNTAQWSILDNFVGWKQIILPISAPDQKCGLWNASSVFGILVKYIDGNLNPSDKLSIELNQITFDFKTTPNLYLSNLQVLQISPLYAPTKYVVDLSGPSQLVFLQNYSPDWHAYLYDDNKTGAELEHTEVFGWANAFNISVSGETRVILIYAPQADRDELLLAWSISAPMAIFCPIIYYSATALSKRKPQKLQF
jgi:hypothetical protein